MLLNKLPKITTIVARTRYLFGVLCSTGHIVLFVGILASKQTKKKKKEKSHKIPDFLFHITIKSLVVFCFWRLMGLGFRIGFH
jgi:hypothetical protein